MLRYLVLTFAFTFGAALFAPGAHAMDITGDYTIVGSTTDGGGEYTGTLTIVKKGEVFQLEWTTGNGKFKGTGLITRGVLSAVWRQGEDIGVSSFNIEEGKLVGTWAYLKTDGKKFKETATKK